MISRKLLVFLSSLSVVALLTLGLMILSRKISGPKRLSSLNTITKFTNLSFPPRTTLVDGEKSIGLSSHIKAKIMMPKSDSRIFVDQPLLRGKLKKNSVSQESFSSVFNKSDWSLRYVQNTSSAEGLSLNKSDGLWIYVDSAPASEEALIYIYYQD